MKRISLAAIAAIAVLSVAALLGQAKAAGTVTCTGTLTGSQPAVVVPAGASCTIAHARIGTLTANGAADVSVTDTFASATSITNSGNVTVTGNHISGGVTCNGNAPLVYSGNSVSGVRACTS